MPDNALITLGVAAGPPPTPNRIGISSALKIGNDLYLRDNFSVTTSGQCSDVPLLASLASMGQERVMYSIDYPYGSSDIAGRFMEAAAISEDTRALVSHRNAEAILKLTS